MDNLLPGLADLFKRGGRARRAWFYSPGLSLFFRNGRRRCGRCLYSYMFNNSSCCCRPGSCCRHGRLSRGLQHFGKSQFQTQRRRPAPPLIDGGRIKCAHHPQHICDRQGGSMGLHLGTNITGYFKLLSITHLNKHKTAQIVNYLAGQSSGICSAIQRAVNFIQPGARLPVQLAGRNGARVGTFQPSLA